MFSVARKPPLQGRGSRLGGGVRLQEGWVPASAGMTGGWGVGGETITWYCSYAGTPPAHTSTGSRHRRIFDSTSGSALGDGFTLWADLPEADVPLSARGFGVTGGGVGGGWGVMTRDWYYAGTPPLILRRAQHEQPRRWGWVHAIGRSSRGGCFTFSAGLRVTWGVGGRP